MTHGFLLLCPFSLDAGLLSKAVELSHGECVRALVPETDAQAAALYGARIIHTLPDSTAAADEAHFAEWLAEKVRLWEPSVVLAPATVRMRSIMPMLANRLSAGLTADCTGLRMDGPELIQTRPAFGNSLMADIRTLSPVRMATVRPGTFRPAERPCEAQLLPEKYSETDSAVRQLGFTPFSGGKPLSQAEIILTGGLGVGSKEGFDRLSALAEAVGASLGASRAAVDAGFAPYSCQIGMTGATVSPRLYIAVGVSGAVQHLAGMSGSSKIIAVNSDPKAPIFDYADYGVVGDWKIVIESLLKEVLS